VAEWRSFEKKKAALGLFSLTDIMQEHWRHQLWKYDIISFWGALDSVSLRPCTNLAHSLIISTFQIVPAKNARFGLPGDRENVVKLNADHSGVCKFGPNQTDQDNFELVRGNIRDLYKNALKKSELSAIPSIVSQEGRVSADEDVLQA
jgi:hypothetical protein